MRKIHLKYPQKAKVQNMLVAATEVGFAEKKVRAAAAAVAAFQAAAAAPAQCSFISIVVSVETRPRDAYLWWRACK